MLILATNSQTGVSITAKDTDLLKGVKRYYAMYSGGFYDPANEFKPCFAGKDGRRRLWDKGVEAYNDMLPEADAYFAKMQDFYAKQTAVTTPAPAPTPAPARSGLGDQLETIMLQVLAEQSTDRVLEIAKPAIEKHIIDTYGYLPQKHEVVFPTKTVQVEGTVHERFDTVLNLVNADIPVFLTGPAGTGKNVLCQQIAEAMELEFYFSNAVTQEYKITGFIDANGTFHETQFYKAFTQGGLFMLDEMDASIPEVLIILNAAIANRYFDFPTGRVEAHENFRLIAAGNTYGTGADMEYSGRFQLDAASLDRFALVEIDYSPAIEKAITDNDTELMEFIHAFRKTTQEVGMKHLATYRSMQRIVKLQTAMDLKEVLKICLLKSMCVDDMKIITETMKLKANKYFVAMKELCA